MEFVEYNVVLSIMDRLVALEVRYSWIKIVIVVSTPQKERKNENGAACGCVAVDCDWRSESKANSGGSTLLLIGLLRIHIIYHFKDAAFRPFKSPGIHYNCQHVFFGFIW